VHASKGSNTATSSSSGAKKVFCRTQNSIGSPDDDTDAAEETRGIEEERRLFYVAVTRARERLWMSRAAKRIRFGKEEPRFPSRFLGEMGMEGVELEDATSNTVAPKGSGSEKLAAFLARRGKKGDASPMQVLLLVLLLVGGLRAQDSRPGRPPAGPRGERLLVAAATRPSPGIVDLPSKPPTFRAWSSSWPSRRIRSRSLDLARRRADGITFGVPLRRRQVRGGVARSAVDPPHVLSLRVPSPGVVVDRIALIPAARVRSHDSGSGLEGVHPGIVDVGAVDGLAPPLLGPIGGAPVKVRRGFPPMDTATRTCRSGPRSR
jgi:hypothetical protein